MEKWQQDFITTNLPDLLKVTICNTNLLAIFKSKGVLSVDDLDLLDAIKSSRGHQTQIYELYKILPTRFGAYKITIEAFHETGQSGARNLLIFGYVHEGHVPPFDFSGEIFDWDSEHFSLYDKILSTVVNVQHKGMSIADVCRNIDAGTLKEIMKRTIDEDNKLQLLSNKCEYVLLSPTIPKKIDYYIHRTLTSRTRLRVNILKENKQDIFLVKEASLNQLAKLVSPNIADRSSSQLENITVRHILCETDEDFHSICQMSPKETNVHLLSFENDSLRWIKSQGSIHSFHDYIHEYQDSLNDKALIESLLCESDIIHPVCISDTPGMGNTILLVQIANEISEAKNHHLVLFFVLREFVQNLPKSLKDITAEKIRELIACQVTESNFGREVVQKLLVCPDQKVEICLDGYDEILDSQIEATRKLLQVICSEFTNTRVLVTTRPHMRRQLEDTLNILGYNILPFDQSNQVDFLVKYWVFNEMQLESRSTILENFANRCLKTLREKMADDELEIAGVPLQCRLLGEIYQRHTLRLLSAASIEDMPLVDSIFQMYQNLVKLRFEKAAEQQKIRDSGYKGTGKWIRLLTNKKSWIKRIKEIHFLVAIDLLFPEFTISAKTVLPFEQDKYLSRREIYSLGLIEEKATFNKNYRFTHRTFAEYLVAEFLVKVITSGYKIGKKREFWSAFLDFFLKKILRSQQREAAITRQEFVDVRTRVSISTFENSVITYFMNAHLKDKRIDGWSLLDIYQHLRGRKFPEQMFYNIFISCAFSNLDHLFNIFMILFRTENHNNFYLPAELLITAAKYSSIQINYELHNLFGNEFQVFFSSDCDKDNLVTPIQTAISRGNHAVVQVILNRHKTFCLSKNVLHMCLSGSYFDSFETIGRKLEIIKLLLEHAPQLSNERLKNDESTPILQTYTNVDLIQCLLENGANVNAISKNNENILHRFLQKDHKVRIEEQELVDLLRLVNKHNFTKRNCSRISLDGETPLTLALRTTFLSPKTLILFHNIGADFNFLNKQKANYLHIAIQSKQSIECLNQLIDYGVQTAVVNSNHESLLHIATDLGNLEAVELLNQKEPSLVHIKDVYGNSPLHIACSRDMPVYLQIQDLLMRSGCDLNLLNNDGCTPVEYGLERIKNLVITVKRLRTFHNWLKIPKNTANKLLRSLILNDNCLNWVVWNDTEFCNLWHFLVSMGGRVNPEEKSCENIYALKTCISEIAKYLHNSYSNKFVKCSTWKNSETLFLNMYNFVLSGDKKNNFKLLNVQILSLESIIFMLLCIQDRHAFRKLQMTFSSLIKSNATKFVSNQLELARFIERKDVNICVIFTDNIMLSIAKVQESTDSLIMVIDAIVYQNIQYTEGETVVVIVPDIELASSLEKYIQTSKGLSVLQSAIAQQLMFCSISENVSFHLGITISGMPSHQTFETELWNIIKRTEIKVLIY